MSKTTVWKSLNSNPKDTRPVAAKKARPHTIFSPPGFDATRSGHLLLLRLPLCAVITVSVCASPRRIEGIEFIDE